MRRVVFLVGFLVLTIAACGGTNVSSEQLFDVPAEAAAWWCESLDEATSDVWDYTPEQYAQLLPASYGQPFGAPVESDAEAALHLRNLDCHQTYAAAVARELDS